MKKFILALSIFLSNPAGAEALVVIQPGHVVNTTQRDAGRYACPTGYRLQVSHSLGSWRITTTVVELRCLRG